MNRNLVLGAVAAAFIGGIIAANTITIGDVLAAPFNASKTTLADAGVVQSFFIFRTATGASMTVNMTVPEVRSLPDGGSRTINITAEGTCTLSGQTLSDVAAFANGPAAACARAANDWEQ